MPHPHSSSTWVRSPLVSPHFLLWGLVPLTAPLSAWEDGTTRAEPPSARHWGTHSLQHKSKGRGKKKKKQRKLNMQSHKLPYSNSRFWLTCQLHIVAQLRGDWQLGVELGGALDGTTIHSFTAVELNHSHDGCSRRKINQLLNRRNLHQQHQSQLSPTQDDRRHMSM